MISTYWLSSPEFQPLRTSLTMAIFNSQVLWAVSAILSWEACSNAKRLSDWPHPLALILRAHIHYWMQLFLASHILYLVYFTIKCRFSSRRDISTHMYLISQKYGNYGSMLHVLMHVISCTRLLLFLMKDQEARGWGWDTCTSVYEYFYLMLINSSLHDHKIMAWRY